MNLTEKFARAMIAVGLILWMLSVIAMILGMPLKDQYPNLATTAFITSVVTQGIWFVGFLWLIFIRVTTVKSDQ